MERDILAEVNHPFIVKLHYGKSDWLNAADLNIALSKRTCPQYVTTQKKNVTESHVKRIVQNLFEEYSP